MESTKGRRSSDEVSERASIVKGEIWASQRHERLYMYVTHLAPAPRSLSDAKYKARKSLTVGFVLE